MKSSIRFVSIFLVAFLITPVAQAAKPTKLSTFPEGERLIYTRLVEAYRHNKMDQVVQERTLLERNYPSSIHLDNAYYLTGIMEYQNNRLAEAIRAFDVVKDRYSKSNKRPAALFAIARSYERLNLAPQAHRVYKIILQEYPGSPESQRAWMQLRMEKTKLGGTVKK